MIWKVKIMATKNDTNTTNSEVKNTTESTTKKTTSKAKLMSEKAMGQVTAHNKDPMFDMYKQKADPEAESAKRKPGRPKKSTSTAEKKPQKPAEAKKSTTVKKSTAEKPKAVSDASTKPDKELFTVSIDKTTKATIKKYSKMTKRPIGEVIAAAILEYTLQNPPTDEQREAYEAKRKEEDIDL